jgi:hypothetical protein
MILNCLATAVLARQQSRSVAQNNNSKYNHDKPGQVWAPGLTHVNQSASRFPQPQRLPAPFYPHFIPHTTCLWPGLE